MPPYSIEATRSKPGHLRTVIAFLSCLIAVFPLVGYSQEPEIPRLSAYATDLTGTLSSSQLSALNGRLKAFEDTTSTQIVVVMVSTIGQDAIEQYTLKVAEANKVGQKGKDNGALLLIAKEDRELRIETGYGLEGALPDALSGLIIRREITPRFREGDYYGGITAGVEAIMLAVRGEYTADPSSKKRDKSPVGIIPFIIFLFFIFTFLRGIFGRRRHPGGKGSYRGWGGIPPVIGGWGGGGGGFCGGGGGFSGGGGSFGGGGASGSW